MKLPCLLCEKDIKIPSIINTKEYDGQIFCRECNTLLEIKLVKSRLEKYKVVTLGFTPK